MPDVINRIILISVLHGYSKKTDIFEKSILTVKRFMKFHVMQKYNVGTLKSLITNWLCELFICVHKTMLISLQ
jgi:hypothetical protein